jgi:asparagine synthase (glutamine-hydrolysing)
MDRPVSDLIDLIDPDSQRLLDTSLDEARRLLLRDDPATLREVSGSYALVARDGARVRLARSLDRPLRYFLAKQASGPLLVVAERIDEIAAWLAEHGFGDQFHPSYSRMAPAHHVTELRLVGCPDPNPAYLRYFDPPRGTLPTDLDVIGQAYVGALLDTVDGWLRAQDPAAPIGVLFSGGVDSGAVLLCLHDLLLRGGQSAARLKAFTLAVDGGGSDLEQARSFLRQVDLEYLGESVEVAAAILDPLAAVALIEDYKPRDVECATVNLALLAALRGRYPDWRLLVDGDGGDENLKDYPIEENPELTIRSVVNNSMLYQEGWGVHSIKHSLTYSGGYSRGCVRTHAPARRFGFAGFSPYAQPAVIAVAEAIPFAELTQGSVAALYGLKGEVMRRGLRHHLGRELPVFAKRRFQEGATPEDTFTRLFAQDESAYRSHFLRLHGAG